MSRENSLHPTIAPEDKAKRASPLGTLFENPVVAKILDCLFWTPLGQYSVEDILSRIEGPAEPEEFGAAVDLLEKEGIIETVPMVKGDNDKYFKYINLNAVSRRTAALCSYAMATRADLTTKYHDQFLTNFARKEGIAPEDCYIVSEEEYRDPECKELDN